MAFNIKKIITFFVEPYGVILLLLSIGLFFLFTNKDRLAKITLVTSFLLYLFISYPVVSNLLVQNLENTYPTYNYDKKIQYIHVLGSGHNGDNSQPVSSNLGESSIKRVIEGIVIHKKTPGSKLIFTGYEGTTDTPNAIMNEKLAILLGVEKENIITGPKAKDTKEEAEFTKSLLNENDKFVLVTSASHMPRAIMLFKSLGLNPIAAPTNFKKFDCDNIFDIPGAGSMEISRLAIHEYIGILWAKITN